MTLLYKRRRRLVDLLPLLLLIANPTPRQPNTKPTTSPEAETNISTAMARPVLSAASAPASTYQFGQPSYQPGPYTPFGYPPYMYSPFGYNHNTFTNTAIKPNHRYWVSWFCFLSLSLRVGTKNQRVCGFLPLSIFCCLSVSRCRLITRCPVISQASYLGR